MTLGFFFQEIKRCCSVFKEYTVLALMIPIECQSVRRGGREDGGRRGQRGVSTSLYKGDAVLGPFLLRVSWSIVACQLPETWSPVAEVGEILFGGGGQRVDGAE